MFGESEAGESPRVASPWEALISTPPSPKYIPKLVPEAEEGNVEYKLQLLSPSPARFARLVTQLKWRLLEGGGQAYYELGVADSGALIGLHRAELERTLETLECMAGEIGASVVVVREIEVPRGMHVRGGDRAGLFVGGAGGRRKMRRWGRSVGSEESTTDDDEDNDDEEDESPSPMTLDASPGLFAMDPDPDPTEYSIDLEISTVYKPRPTRLQSQSSFSSTSPSTSNSGTSNSNSRSPSNPSLPSSSTTAKPKWYPKKKHQHLLFTQAPNNGEIAQGHGEGYIRGQTKQQAKALSRRLARDRRREEKRLRAAATAESNSNPTNPINPPQDEQEIRSHHRPHTHLTQTPIDARTSAELVSGLESLHVTIDPGRVPIPSATTTISNSNTASTSIPMLAPLPVPAPVPVPVPSPLENPPSPSPSPSRSTVPVIDITPPTAAQQENPDGKTDGDEEVRLIVEALVVRKLSLEEAFLDFGGFSLI